MSNPWKDISLSDYENHMSLDSVMQLQSMNQTPILLPFVPLYSVEKYKWLVG